MGRVQHDEYAEWVDARLDGIRYLLRQPLLQLRAGRQSLDHPRQLSEADDSGARHVGDVRDPDERKQMVFADRAEVDVAQQNQFAEPIGAGGEVCTTGEVAQRVAGEPGKEFGVRLGHPLGSVSQPGARGVLADRRENLGHGRLDTWTVDRITVGRAAVG